MALAPVVVDPEEDIPRLLRDLRTQVDGLDDREVARRLAQVGPNEIRREAGRHWWRGLLEQFTHPLALLLWIAAGLSLATGVVALSVAIVVVIALNAAPVSVEAARSSRSTPRDSSPATCCCSPRATACRPTHA